MVVDDSDFARASLRSLLGQGGYQVVAEAANGTDALRLVKEKKPHLVLVDVVMPEMSGIQLTESIITSFPQVGVIVVSSLNQEQVVLEAIAAGASDFLAKPLNPTQVLEAVEKFLKNVPKD